MDVFNLPFIWNKRYKGQSYGELFVITNLYLAYFFKLIKNYPSNQFMWFELKNKGKIISPMLGVGVEHKTFNVSAFIPICQSITLTSLDILINIYLHNVKRYQAQGSYLK